MIEPVFYFSLKISVAFLSSSYFKEKGYSHCQILSTNFRKKNSVLIQSISKKRLFVFNTCKNFCVKFGPLIIYSQAKWDIAPWISDMVVLNLCIKAKTKLLLHQGEVLNVSGPLQANLNVFGRNIDKTTEQFFLNFIPQFRFKIRLNIFSASHLDKKSKRHPLLFRLLIRK